MINEEDEEYSLGMLTVYQYSKNKIKCDYSIIPVSWDYNNNAFLQSGVSKEKISIEGFKVSKNPFCLPADFIKFDKQKEGDGCKVSILAYGSLEVVENRILTKLYKEFKKHFWYKFKYKKFLDKKKNMRQINF